MSIIVIVRRLQRKARSGLSISSTNYSYTDLIKLILAALPIPKLAAKFRPIIIRALTPSYPGEVIETAASTEDFSSRVGLLDSLIVWPLNHGGLVAPVVFAVAEFKGSSWCCDHRFITRIA